MSIWELIGVRLAWEQERETPDVEAQSEAADESQQQEWALPFRNACGVTLVEQEEGKE